jgi:hypothetical protein
MTQSDQQIAGEVETACRRYYADYPAALWRWLTEDAPIDYAALGCWTFPMLLIIGTPDGTIVTVSDEAFYDSQVRAAYDQYYAEGWAGRLNLDRIKVTLASANAALVEVRGTRFRADGSDLNHWDACYLFQRTADGWRQHAVIDVEPPRPAAADWIGWLATAGPITGGSRA